MSYRRERVGVRSGDTLDDTYEIDTVVHRHRSRVAWLMALLVAAAAIEVGFSRAMWVPALATLLPVAWVFLVPRVSARARVRASVEGLRVGHSVFPRASFRGAFLKHEGERTYVALHGRANLEVEVPNNIEADALVRALGLDAASSTVEVALGAALGPSNVLVLAGVATVTSVAMLLLPTATREAAAVASGLALLLGLVWWMTRVHLRVGADGVLLRRPLRKDRFVPHDAITNVLAEEDAVVVELQKGRRIVLRVPGVPSGDENKQRMHNERRADGAAAIVRRIQQARRAFREHRLDPAAVAAVLARGSSSTRDWLERLERLGEGAATTFRTMGVSRAQLFEIVESTTTSARDRITAAIALRDRASDEEKLRIRVAAERCALPELRERIVRIVDTDSDEELEEALGELEREA